jgi:hypothetical protein
MCGLPVLLALELGAGERSGIFSIDVEKRGDAF